MCGFSLRELLFIRLQDLELKKRRTSKTRETVKAALGRQLHVRGRAASVRTPGPAPAASSSSGPASMLNWMINVHGEKSLVIFNIISKCICCIKLTINRKIIPCLAAYVMTE